MIRDRQKRGKKEDAAHTRRERRLQSPPIVRSPALESAESERAARQKPSPSLRRHARVSTGRNMGHMSFAAEETVVRPEQVGPRKSLPRNRNNISKFVASSKKDRQQHTGLTASWRASGPLQVKQMRQARQSVLTPEASKKADVNARESLQAISEEEQKRLAELEMRLPRIAGKMDASLLAIVLSLLCIGLVMVYSSSAFLSARYFGDASSIFQKQLLWALLGIVVMFISMRIDYRLWRRFSLIGMIITFPMLIIVLKFGTSAYGASRWLGFGSFFSFQPSELIKLVLALYVADWLARKGNKVGTFLYGLAPFIILVGAILGLVLLENDMGTAVIIAGLATAMFFTAGANIIQFLLAMGCGGLIFLTQAFKGYRFLRIIGFLDPFKHTTDINLQLYQSLLALGSGGWFGVGLGLSRQKTGYLPLPYIDSIFAITGEEIGFIGCAIVVILFMFLAFRGFRLARRTQDMYGSLLATGITTWLVLQAIINIASTTGSIPYTGVPLPFISFGGSSLVISMAAVGVLLNISRYIQKPEASVWQRTITTTMKRQIAKA